MECIRGTDPRPRSGRRCWPGRRLRRRSPAAPARGVLGSKSSEVVDVRSAIEAVVHLQACLARVRVEELIALVQALRGLFGELGDREQVEPVRLSLVVDGLADRIQCVPHLLELKSRLFEPITISIKEGIHPEQRLVDIDPIAIHLTECLSAVFQRDHLHGLQPVRYGGRYLLRFEKTMSELWPRFGFRIGLPADIHFSNLNNYAARSRFVRLHAHASLIVDRNSSSRTSVEAVFFANSKRVLSKRASSLSMQLLIGG